jgi:Domain of unknown function (DUF6378)
MNNTRTEILSEASKIISGDRDAQYGQPEDCFAAIAAHWTIHLRTRGILSEGQSIQDFDVGIMMTFLKAVRCAHKPLKRDSYVDGSGYFACAAECALKPVPEGMSSDVSNPVIGKRVRSISRMPKRGDANVDGMIHLVLKSGVIEPVHFNAAGFHMPEPPAHWAGWFPWNEMMVENPMDPPPQGTLGVSVS